MQSASRFEEEFHATPLNPQADLMKMIFLLWSQKAKSTERQLIIFSGSWLPLILRPYDFI